jgi:hypothetical protein
MRILLAAILGAAVSVAAPLRFHQSGFSASPEGWTTSGYDYPTYVMDPDGEILSQARERGQAAITTVDLNRRYTDPHLGDMRGRRMKEKRVDVGQPLPGLN